MAKRNCLHCQGEFNVKPSLKRDFCSTQCYAAHCRSKNTHKCKECDKEFYRVPGHAKRAKVGLFCSRKCFDKWEKGENNPTYAGGKIECTCEACGTVFLVKPSRLKKSSNAGKFCSYKCRGRSMEGENHHAYATDRVVVSCEVCGKTRSLAPSHAKGVRFCSRECQGIAKRAENSGQKNGRYVHGQADLPYPMGFTTRLKRHVRDRHDGKCALCGSDEVGNGKRAMDVHHIDYNKENLDQWNLVPLCRVCHGKMHGSAPSRKEWSAKLLRLLDDYKKIQQ